MRNKRENAIRRCLGLGPAPDPVGMEFREVPADPSHKHPRPYLTMVSRPEEDVAADKLAWHREDWRADAADILARLPSIAARRYDAARGQIERQRASRALASARTLRFTSYYIHPIDECEGIEGYFQLDNDFSYALEIIASPAMVSYAKGEWERGSVVTSSNSLLFADYSAWAVAPVESLDEIVVLETLQRWYKERFAWQRGHWSQLENRLPVIEVDLSWETAEGLR